MAPLIPILGASILAWLIASRPQTVSTNTVTGDLYAEGEKWREAALGTLPTSATLVSALVTRVVWHREGDWAASNGKLYYRIT